MCIIDEVGLGIFRKEKKISFELDENTKLIEDEDEELKFYNSKTKKYDDVDTENLKIFDNKCNVCLDVEIEGDNKVYLTFQKKFTVNLRKIYYLEEEFSFAFNYNKRLFYVVSNPETVYRRLFEVKFNIFPIYNFIMEKMENYNFSENEIKLARFFLNDFLHHMPSFEHECDNDENVIVRFSDGEKEISKKKLYKLQSNFVVEMIENLSKDEKIDIFSELSFYEFQKCFYTNLRSNNYSNYFLLHKICSRIFSQVSVLFMKLFFKLGNGYTEEEFDDQFYNVIFGVL